MEMELSRKLWLSELGWMNGPRVPLSPIVRHFKYVCTFFHFISSQTIGFIFLSFWCHVFHFSVTVQCNVYYQFQEFHLLRKKQEKGKENISNCFFTLCVYIFPFVSHRNKLELNGVQLCCCYVDLGNECTPWLSGVGGNHHLQSWDCWKMPGSESTM